MAFWRTVNGETSLQLYNVETKETESVPIQSDNFTPEGWEPIHWIGDKFLIQSQPSLYFLKKEGTVERFDLEDEYTNITDIDPSARRYLYIYYPDGLGPGGDQWTLRLYDSETGEKKTLTDHPEQWGHAGFSPNEQWIAYRENPTEAFGDDRLVIADINGNQERTFHVGDPASRARLYDWHPDGDRLLLDDRSTGWYQVGLHDWQTEETTWIESDEHNEFPLTILPDGDHLVTARFEDGQSTGLVYTLNGETTARELELPAGIIDRRTRLGAASRADQIYLKHETATCPPRLLSYNLTTNEATALVETETDALKEVDLVDAEHITYDAPDNLSVNAVLHRAPEPPSPAVVKVHGGPTQAVYRGFDPFAQYLVAEGYTVLQPNYRGSTDQGREFEDAIRGEVGGGAVDDVAAGGQWLAEKDWIDANALAVFGHSAGAYNAAMQTIRYPELWQAAIAENGSMDRVELLNDPNQYALRRLIENPEIETKESYLRERSPVHRAADIDCPICLIHGKSDPNVDMSRNLVDRLEERGWTENEEYRFEILEGEGHVIGDKKRFWRLVVNILEGYLSGI